MMYWKRSVTLFRNHSYSVSVGWQGRQVFSFAGANCDNLFICPLVECFRKSCILFTPPSVSWMREGVFDITVRGGKFIDLEHLGQYDKISIILNGKFFWSCVVLRKKWDKVFKIGLNEVFEGCLLQNLLSPLLNTLSHLCLEMTKSIKLSILGWQIII